MSSHFFDNRLKVFAALLLPAFILYFKSFFYGFSILDEQWLIFDQRTLLESWSNIPGLFTASVARLYYRPLLMLSLMMDYHLGGVSPVIYHVTNVLLHLLSVALLYRFLLFFTGRPVAFVLSLLFSLHPAMAHAVAWVPGRNDSLLCVFTLLSLIYWNRFLIEKRNSLLILHLLFFLCALLTKENAIVLPVIFIANGIVYMPLKAWRKFLWPFLCWLSLSVGWLWLRGSLVSHDNYFNHTSEALRNFIPAFLLYFGKALLPVQQALFPTLANTSLIPGAVTVLIVVMLWLKPGLVNKKNAAFGLFIFCALLLLPVWFGAARRDGEHYEHRMYTSMIGWTLFLSQLRFTMHLKFWKGIAVVMVVAFAIKTSLWTNVYATRLSFVNECLRDYPDHFLFQYKKAETLFSQGDYKDAVSYLDKAIGLRPDKTDLYSNRGMAYCKLGEYDKAIPDFTKAMQQAPSNPYYMLNRCKAYEAAHDTIHAIKDLVSLQQSHPEIIPAELGNMISSEWQALLAHVNTQLAQKPEEAALYDKRAELFQLVNMQAEAQNDVKQARVLSQKQALKGNK